MMNRAGAIPFFLILAFVFSINTKSTAQEFKHKHNINGISIWSDEQSRTVEDFDFVRESEANWVSFQPYGFVKNTSSGVLFDIDSFWNSSSFNGLIGDIQIAKELGYSVFLKPHIILEYDKAGAWVGDLRLGEDANWDLFKTSYADYVIRLAGLADSVGVELFSLGTEIQELPRDDSLYWQQLIDTVRVLYHGSLTFCANFDAYNDYPFWDQMDYIGIDAYFSIDKSKNADLSSCRKGWEPFVNNLEDLSKKWNKKILFTEYGYMSTDYCAFEPFEQQSASVNLVSQANAYRALFDAFWYQDWFIGGFSWIWGFDNDEPENYDNTTYSPQNKPAAGIIAKYYKAYR